MGLKMFGIQVLAGMLSIRLGKQDEGTKGKKGKTIKMKEKKKNRMGKETANLTKTSRI